MLGFLLRLLVNAVALVCIADFSGGTIEVKNKFAAFFAAFAIGVLNALVKPVLMFFTTLLTLPLSCLTLGLWTLVLSWLMNAVIFCWAADLVGGFEVKTFPAALAGSLVLSIVNGLVSGVFSWERKSKKKSQWQW